MKDLKKKRRSGFTLVEMVVVVSILGILAGLGFMKFDQVQVKARENADYVAATNLATAASLYINEVDSLDEIIEKTLDLNELVNAKYITVVPQPQSLDGEFSVEIGKLKEITVKLGDQQLYPKPTIEDNN